MQKTIVDQIVDTLIEASEAYYKGEPIMSDADFDEMEERLRLLDPNNEYFNRVGYRSIESGKKIPLSKPMLSISKLKNYNEVKSWYRANKISEDTDLIGELKVDGVSGSLVYKKGKLIYGTTRGNGEIGELIDFVGKVPIKSIPDKIPFNGICEVRGEFYIPVEFGKTELKDTPLRNLCAGTLTKGGENIKYLRFVAYQIVIVEGILEPLSTEISVIEWLRSWKFKTIPFVRIKSLASIKSFYEDYVNRLRDNFDYETDGVVIIVNDKQLQQRINDYRIVRKHNFYNFCLKPPSKRAKSTLLDIEINVSRTGRLVPVAIYTPVIIDNVEFERATMDNYDRLKSFGTPYVGNTVTIMRANDVIPKLMEMEHDGDKTKPIKVPMKHCPSCGSKIKLNGKHMICDNINCPGRAISTIYNWVVKRNMKNIGERFLELAYKEGIIKSILDLYDPNLEKKLEKLERFVPGGGRIKNIISAIEKSKKNVTDIDILTAIGIPGIGRAVLEKYDLTNINTLPKDLTNKENSHLAVYRYISDWLTQPNNYAMLVKLKKILNSESTKVDTSAGSVCITGTFDLKRKDLEKLLKEKGYKVTNQVTKNTDYLIVGEEPGGSKMNNAEKYKTKIINLEDLIK